MVDEHGCLLMLVNTWDPGESPLTAGEGGGGGERKDPTLF